MYLPSLQRTSRDISPDDAFNYAPAAGRPELRERWREKLLAREPGAARARRSACRS